MKKITVFLLCFCLLFGFGTVSYAKNEIKNEAETPAIDKEIDSRSAVLMEASSGKLLYAKKERSA